MRVRVRVRVRVGVRVREAAGLPRMFSAAACSVWLARSRLCTCGSG